MTLRCRISTICFLIAQLCLLAQAGDTEAILIRNVRLIDRDAEAEDVVVNILIKDRKVDIVTRDPIPASERIGQESSVSAQRPSMGFLSNEELIASGSR